MCKCWDKTRGCSKAVHKSRQEMDHSGMNDPCFMTTGEKINLLGHNCAADNSYTYFRRIKITGAVLFFYYQPKQGESWYCTKIVST